MMEEPSKNFHKFNEALILEEGEREVYAGFFRSRTGIEKIYYKRSQPQNNTPKIHLFAIHDMGQYHGSYQALIKYLIKKCSKDIAITVVDLKGHGLSSGTRAFVNSFQEYRDDIISLIKRENYGANWSKAPQNILLGQGMGALICLDVIHHLSFSGDDRWIHGSILLNPLLKLKFQLPTYANFALKGWRKKLAGPALGRVRVPISLSKYYQTKGDPLVLEQVSISLLSELMRAGEELKTRSYFIDRPLLFLLGEQSSYCDVDRATLFHKGIQKKFSKCLRYPKFRHDMLNDIGNDLIFSDLHKWLSEFLPKN